MKVSALLRFLFSLIIVIFFVQGSATASNCSDPANIIGKFPQVINPLKYNLKTIKADGLNQKLQDLLGNSGITSYREIKKALLDSILINISDKEIDSLVKSDSYYLAGMFYFMDGIYNKAEELLTRSYKIRELIDVSDERAARILYNLGITYSKIGDFYATLDLNTKAITLYKNIYGESDKRLIDPYSLLITTYIELQETEKAISVSNIALSIAKANIDSFKPQSMADIYANLGVCYSRQADFSNARVYFENSKAIYERYALQFNENYINLINSLAITYEALGLKEKSVEYYRKGIKMALDYPESSSLTFNIINSYAINMANSGELIKAEALYILLLKKAGKYKVNEAQIYYEVLNNYADFLREYKIDSLKALKYDSICMGYIRKYPEDLLMRNRIYVNYSLSLLKTGDYTNALNNIQELINLEYPLDHNSEYAKNPDLKSIPPNKTSLRIFRTKYIILLDYFRKTDNIEVLKTAANTSELIIGLLEKMRINITEEESRLLLGNKYRDLYLNAIRNFNDLYKLTADNGYLNKAFEYSEKSKVAGLLASTRELKAAQLQIPYQLGQFEFSLKRDLGTLNAMLSDETNKKEINNELRNSLNEKILKTTRIRDSLIAVFSSQYPAYYAVKYNTKVTDIASVPKIVGRNGNYLNYILSDTVLYIFVVNRKHNNLISISVDSTFMNDVKQFRNLLSYPKSYDDASSAFSSFQKLGYQLYRTLIEPIRPYLISDRLIISPDNMLSYIPFETLPVTDQTLSNLRYRSLHYLLEDFDISYTYSATFLAESNVNAFSLFNKSVSFAPNYNDLIDIKSVLMSRQEEQGFLRDLPYARMEAKYVSEITHGTLYENSEAKESVFKKVSGEYDIIHLAMHTLLNDKDPMRSTLIFSPESDTLNDGYLKTFEVYGIPLKAKMVVLSSCNTGSGFLSTGEGILSLARGFIYSGSQSVVMSMWEIEDRSGTEIVKLFYNNLKNGYEKSVALRKARIDYLKKSDNLRSHPYFWSALVVYGNNTPMYFSRNLLYSLIIISLIIIAVTIYYFRKRRYS